MNAIDAYATGVIFPFECKAGEEELINLHYISEYNKTTSFYTIPICIPQIKTKSIVKWQADLNELVEYQISALRQIVESERRKKLLIDDVMNKIDLSEYINELNDEKRLFIMGINK